MNGDHGKSLENVKVNVEKRARESDTDLVFLQPMEDILVLLKLILNQMHARWLLAQVNDRLIEHPLDIFEIMT